MKVLSILSSLFLALPATSLRIIFPLYLYPGDSASAWEPVTSAIESNSGVEWQIIINPNSGPGTTSTLTDANLIAGIAKISSYSNVETVGYVNTEYGEKSIDAVNAEVDVYASWSKDSTSKLSIGGIYFDCVSSETTSNINSYYETVAKHSRSSITADNPQVVFNPGTIAPAQLFSYCDTMVEFEASLADYQSQNPIQKIPEQYRQQSAFQVYSTPESTDVKTLVQTMAQGDVEAVYMGTDCCYKEYSKTLIQNLAEAVSDQESSCST